MLKAPHQCGLIQDAMPPNVWFGVLPEASIPRQSIRPAARLPSLLEWLGGLVHRFVVHGLVRSLGAIVAFRRNVHSRAVP